MTHDRSQSKHAMTLIEMIMGMMVMSMVMLSLSSMWYALARTWSDTSGEQAASTTGNQAVLRIQNAVRQAKYLAQCVAGNLDSASGDQASLLMWRSDNWAGSADLAPQIGELNLMEYDPVRQRLYLYQPLAYSAMSADQKTRAGLTVTWADLSANSTRTAFKSYDFVKVTVLSEAVSGAKFGLPAQTTSSRQNFEFTIRTKRDSFTSLFYDTVTVRAPTTKPS